MSRTQVSREYPVVKLGTDGAWHGYVDFGRDPRTGRRRRVHVRRMDRQEAVYLTLRARAAAHIARRGRYCSEQPDSAAEWFWLWLSNGSYRKAAGIFTRHRDPFVEYVLPALDERSLEDLDAQEMCRLINAIPYWDGKEGAYRVFAAALRTARERGWVTDSAARLVQVVSALPPQLVFDDNAAFDPPDDLGMAVVCEL